MDRSVYERMKAHQERHWWFRGRRSVLRGLLDGIDVPASARILEVGCGTGGNLDLLRRYGRVAAVEPDEECRIYVQTQLGLEVAAGALPHDLPFEPEQFDLICALDVIEHVDDDLGALKVLRRLLRPGGRLLTTVPAYPWMWSPHDVLHHHKRRYRRGDYLRLHREAGFCVEKATHFNMLLLPLAVAQRLWKRALRLDTADDALPSPPLNWALYSVFAAERAVVRRGVLPAGLSLAVIAGKSAAS